MKSKDDGAPAPIISIAPAHREVALAEEYNTEALVVLEQAAERARGGTGGNRITSCMVLLQMADGQIEAHWSPALDMVQRLGSLEILKHDWLSRKEPLEPIE